MWKNDLTLYLWLAFRWAPEPCRHSACRRGSYPASLTYIAGRRLMSSYRAPKSASCRSHQITSAKPEAFLIEWWHRDLSRDFCTMQKQRATASKTGHFKTKIDQNLMTLSAFTPADFVLLSTGETLKMFPSSSKGNCYHTAPSPGYL